jgi:hypothetical protein
MLGRGALLTAAIAAFFAGAAALAQPDIAAVKLGETRYFKNWAAGCDNVLACEAVAMLPPELPQGMLSLVLSRGADKNAAPKINIFGFDSESDRYQIFVDDALVSAGAMAQDIAPISVTGKDTIKLIRAMVRGREARVVDGSGKLIGHISLAGSSAALRYLDVTQRRAGTADALVARGKRRFRANAAELPVIMAQRIVPANEIPDAGALVALAESGNCAAARVGVTQDAVYGLGTTGGKPRVLALISCGNGAYNLVSAPYVGTLDDQGKWKFAAAKFDYDSSFSSDDNAIKLIGNAAWDAPKQTLTTVTKARGIGDCGASADYIWDGEMFRLTHARVMGECQGSVDWITVWRAQVQMN